MSWVYQKIDLKKILKGVSRSFYLSLILLPRRVRLQMGLAFLACKAADTIADTELIAETERLKLLDAYRELFAGPAAGDGTLISRAALRPGGGSAAEQELIRNLPSLMEALRRLPAPDWLLIRELVTALTQGMRTDLTNPVFETQSQLDQYTYDVAGIVGRFWTRVIKTHFAFAASFGAEVERLGERLGKGLQLVNVLRDLPLDLRRGRSYIPKEMTEKQGLEPALQKLAEKARDYLSSYRPYLSFYPWHALRLKALVRLPARLGFQTLDLLASSGQWLNPAETRKVSRRQVYQTLLYSFLK